MIYDRGTKQLIQGVEYGAESLQMLYTSAFGRMLLGLVVSRPVSWLYGLYNRTHLSAHKIQPTIRRFEITADEFTKNNFKSFNDFFIRELKASARPLASKPNALIAPADAKVSYYPIDDNLSLKIKGCTYSLPELVHDSKISEFDRGTCLVFRLTMDDCHRYIYADSGKTIWTKNIPGVLHTVQPIAHARAKPYVQNQRVISLLSGQSFGEVIIAEIGALLVGVIRNHNKPSFKRGDEKGYFELGGSTIVMLFKQGVVRIDPDIVDYSKQDIEIKVRRGESIGTAVHD